MLRRGQSYDEVYRGFRWQLPERFNIGVAACDRLATGDGRLALVYEAPDGTVERFSFDDLKRLSNRCANALVALGIGRGDRVGVLLPQRPETAIAHLAIYKLGAVAVPLFVQFGRPVVKPFGPADEGAGGNDGIGMKSRKKEFAVEAVHAPAEPDQAIEDVLAVEQLLEPGEPLRRESLAHAQVAPEAPFLAIPKL